MNTKIETKQMIEIAIGGSDRGKAINQILPWEGFCERLQSPKIDRRYTVEQYKALDADTKAKAKKTGFFAGGPSTDGSRNRKSIVARSILTLDLDKITDAALAEGIRARHIPGIDFEAFVYTTRSHDPEAPRIRVVAPFNRMVDEQEYSALSRIIASRVDPGLAQTDSASSLIAQIMYLPSISSDQEYIAFRQNGPVLDPDVLLEGVDLNDGADKGVPLYPQERTRRISSSDQLGDPREKPGIVGAFCRAYSIEGAMNAYLAGVYTPTAEEGRLTYRDGSTSGGAKVYGDYLHSWHNTDPCSGLTVNAYDLVRLHRFHSEDEEATADTPYMALPSQERMRKLAMRDARVVAELSEDERPITAESFDDAPLAEWTGEEVRAEGADETVEGLIEALELDAADPEPEAVDFAAFEQGAAEIEELETEEEDPDAWKEALDYERIEGKAGKSARYQLKPGSYNAGVILACDPRVKGVIALDEFRDRTIIRKPLILDFPGATSFLAEARGTELSKTMVNVLWGWMQAPDHQGGYGFKPTRAELESAIDVAAAKNKYNPLIDMITSVDWDGKERLNDYLIRHLGCDDNAYTRAVGRLLLVAMVARAYEPGAKFDFVTVLEGAEGLGKSTFVRALSGDFYSSIAKGDMRETKRMLDKINSSWVVEMPELAVFKGEDPEQIAALISETADQERRAFERQSLRYLRRNVFVATTNERQYLNKRTGNRRFWPITIRRAFDARVFAAELPQLYAEACAVYRRMRSETETGPDGVERLLYPGDLPLHLPRGSDEERIALGLQMSRLVEQTEDSVLGAAIGILTTDIEELRQSVSIDTDVLERLKTTKIRTVSDAGEVIEEQSYLEEISIWVLHDMIFPDTEYHSRQSALTKAIPTAPWTQKGRRIRFGSSKYGQQVLYQVDVSALLNQASIDLGENLRCEDGICGTIKGIAAYKARAAAGKGA